MNEFKECANQNCTNEKEWNLNEYHRAEGIERLKICLCNSCITSFNSKTKPSAFFAPYINLVWATKKGM